MSKEPHPETIPDVQPFEENDTFIFSLAASADVGADLESRINTLEDRISKLVRRKELQINGVPVVQHLIGMTHDRDELRNIGKALIRMSELMPELAQLHKQKSIIDMAKEDPRWLMTTFADFSSEIESFITNDDTEA